MSVEITELTPAEQYLEIFDGETSSFLSIEGENYVEVHSGGTLTDSVVTELSFVVGDSGSLMKTIFVTSGSEIYVDGEAEDVFVESKGQFSISYGGKLKKGQIQIDGVGVVYSSATATEVSVTSGRYFVNGGTVASTVVMDGGDFAVQTVQNSEEGPVYTGLAQSTLITGGTMRLENGGTAGDTTVSAGLFRINSGAADKTTVAGGSMIVSVGNTVQNTTVNGGNVEIESAAAQMTVLNGGEMRVLAGTAQDTTLNGGRLEVLSGTASNTVVGSGAVLFASEATLEGVTMSGGIFTASTASVAGLTMNDGEFQAASVAMSGLTVKGGTASLDDVSTLSGKSVFAKEASITVDGTVEFDTQFATETEAQITGGFSVGENVRYTLSAEPDMGVYLLVTDATGLFENVDGIIFGDYTLALDMPQKIGELVYTLNLNEDASLTLTISEPLVGAIFVNSEWAELPDGTEVEVSGVTATIGVDAFATGDEAAPVAVAVDGKLRIVGGVVSFTDPIIKDTAVFSGATLTDSTVAATGKLVVNNGATLTGKSGFAEGADITINGTILFDTAFATATEAQISGLSVISGNTKYTLNDTAKTVGVYLLASGAAAFNSPVAFDDVTLTVGSEAVVVGDFTYALSVTDNGELALTVETYVPPTPTLAYVDSEWAALEDGTVVVVGETAATAIIGYDAFAALAPAEAAVTEDGAVEVFGGTISFADGYSKPVTVDAGATVVGKAVFDKAITVNGTVAFDTASATAEAAQFGGFSFVTGMASYTLTDAAPAAGIYLLAADAAAFESPVTFGDVVLTVGAKAAVVGNFSYALSLTEGTLVLTVAEYITPTLAYVNSEWSALEDGDIVIVGETTATIGYDAFAALAPAIATVTADGAVEVVGGTISFADGYSKTITVDAGATVVGKATFNAPITVNGTVMFDAATATAETAQFNGFSFVTGTASYALTVAAPADGIYLLATDAAGFNSPVKFGVNTLTVGADPVLIGDYTYALTLTEGTLALTITEFVPPAPTVDYVYVNSAWAGLASGTVVPVGGTTATIGIDAFATGDIAIASVTDDGMVEVVGGEVNFTKATAKSVTVDADASLVGRNTFAKAITVNGTVAFDTQYATATEAQFGGFSFMTGTATYTLDAAAAAGTWLLASGVTEFTGPVLFGNAALVVGAPAVQIGDFTYALSLTEGNLSLTVAEYVPPAPPVLAYVNSGWSALEEGTVVIVGETSTAIIGYDAFAALVPAEAAVTEDGSIEVVGGEITFGAYTKPVTVNAGASVVGKNTFDKAITVNGTIVFDTAFATDTEAQFSGFSFATGTATYTLNAAAAAGAWLLASGVTTFTAPVKFGVNTLTVGADPVLIGDYTYALTLTEGTLALTVSEFVPPTPTVDYVYVNSAWAGLASGTVVPVGGTTATIGIDAFATGDIAVVSVTDDGMVEVVGGEVNFTKATAKSVTVDADASLIGKNTFAKAITVNGTVAFDTQYATATEAQFGGFSFVTGTAAYTLTDAVPAAGVYLLASGVTAFASAVQFGDVALTVGSDPVLVGDFTYALTLTEGTLALTVEEYIPPVGPALAYVNSEWADLEPGTEVIVGGTTATIGYDAFAALAPAEAAVAEDGAVEVVGGVVSFADGYTKPVTVDAGATVIGKAVFDKAITVNGTVAFDTAFATATEAQFGGFSFVSGTAAYTLTDAVPAVGIYLLASGVTGFADTIQFNDVVLTVGAEPVVVGDFTYALTLAEGTLALTVEEYIPPVDLYVNSDWSELAPGTVVTIGGGTAVIGIDAFATGDGANAVAAEKDTIYLVNGEAFFTEAAHGIVVLNGATLLIENEAGIDQVDVTSGGLVHMAAGVMTKCLVAGGYVTAESGALIDGLTITNCDGLRVFIDGATVNNAVISGYIENETAMHGIMSVAGEGGLVQGATVIDGGYLAVSSGGCAENLVLAGDPDKNLYGDLYVAEGGSASGIMVSSGGYLNGNYEAVVTGFTVLSGGQAYFEETTGGNAVVSGGLLGIGREASFLGIKLGAGGSMYTANSAGIGSAYDTEIQSGGSMANYGYASNTMVLGGGTMYCAYGLAELTEVQSGGSVAVYNGTMRGVTVQSGGVLAPAEECYGGTFTGHVTVLEGATVSMSASQTINFDISGLPDPDLGDLPLVIGFSRIEGLPELTLTVSAEGQTPGVYLLANGVTGFDRGITFGEYTLTLGGEPVKYDGATYRLSLSDDVLLLRITVPMPVVYVNSEWSVLADGTVVTIDEEAGITAVIGVDAFATGDDALANTQEDGVVNIVGGSASFSPDKAVDRDIVIDKGATLTGKADFADGVTILNNGTAAFDTAFATATEAQFTGFSAEGEGSFTLTVQDGHAVAGTSYLLATDAASLVGSEVVFGDFTYTVGGNDFYVDGTAGKKGLSYALSLTGDKELVLSFVNVVNGPDDRKNDWLYDKKLGGLNPDIGTFPDTLLVDGVSDVAVDRKGSVKDKINGTTYYNFVSMNDTADYAKITLDSAARLSFTVSATDAAKFVVYSLVTGVDKKGATTYTMKALQSTTLKKDKLTGLYGATTKNLLLDLPQDGEDKEYYISVQSTNKKSAATGYNVSLNYDAGTKDSTLYYSDGDDGTNDWLYNKKDKENPVNTALVDSDPVMINSSTDNVPVDAADTVYYIDEYEAVWTNFTGFGDDTDFVKIGIDTPSKLSFDVSATTAAKITVWSFTTGLDKKGNVTYTLKALQTTSLKKTTVQVGKFQTRELYTATTKGLLMDMPAENQQYYISVQSTNAKKGDETYYNVSLGEIGDNCGFYVDADNGWNNYVYDKKNTEAPLNLAVYGADPFMIGPDTVNVQVDTEGTVAYDDGYTVWTNYTGFGDDTDFVRIGLEKPASLSLDVSATTAAKITVWSLTTGLDKKGNVTYTLKALQTTSLKKTTVPAGKYQMRELYMATTKNLLLAQPAENQEYFISVQSTNAKKGDSAYYNVTVGDAAFFYADADNGWNNYLYDKKAKEPVNPNIDEFVTTEINTATTDVLLDKPENDQDITDTDVTGWNNFVGFGDDTDFARITIGNNTSTLSFTLTATDAAKFVIYSFTKVNAGGGNYVYSMQALQTTTLKKAKGSDVYTADTKALALSKGEYYIAMQSTNAAKGAAAYYNVTVNKAMSSGLPKVTTSTSAAADPPDELFAGQNADVLAGVAAYSADSALVSDMLSKESAYLA